MTDTAAAFALGSPDAPRSLVWRAWTRDDEFHLAARRGTEAVELTAFATGRWRIDVNGEVGLKGYCQALPIIVDRFGQKAEHVWYPYTEKKYKDIATALKVMWTTPLRKLLS